MGTQGTRFDWYEATFDNSDDESAAVRLGIALGGRPHRGKARNGYAVCWDIQAGGVVLAQVYGRSARLGEVHVSITSEACDEGVPVLRRLFPAHRVSRADSSLDLAAEFGALDQQVLEFATARGLSHRLITGSDGGATRYVGSPRSEVRMRLYKKTEQLRSLHPDRAGEIPEGIVRFELQTRPGKRAVKEQVSVMNADDLWGASAWSAELAALMLSIEAERVSTHFRRPSDWARSLHFLGVQYGPMVRRRSEEVGQTEALRELVAALGIPA